MSNLEKTDVKRSYKFEKVRQQYCTKCYLLFTDVQVDGQEVLGGTENSGVVGCPLELGVGITNTSGAPLPSLSLRITAFQDHQNGHLNYRLDAKMTTIGATKLTTPQAWHSLYICTEIENFCCFAVLVMQ